MGLRYAQPDNEDAFEQMCLRFYRKLWKNENLMLYAKRGENQDGIDICDPNGLKPLRAVQCKHHEPTKPLTPAEIAAEVSKAENSAFPLETYVIATTAKKSRRAQDAVAALNRRPAGEKQFAVEIHFWEDICERLGQFTHIQTHFILLERDIATDVLASYLRDPDIKLLITNVLSNGHDERASGAFSEIEQLLADRKLDTAQYELGKLSTSVALRRLSTDDEYQLLRLRAKLALEIGEFEAASRLFLEAYELQPGLEQAKQNQVLAYALVPDRERAFTLATEYAAAGLVTPSILCRLIENASRLEHLREHDALIAPHLTTSADVNIALSHKLLTLGDAASAADAAARAMQIDPGSPHAHFASGMCDHHAAATGTWQRRKQHLEHASTRYDKAVAECRKQNYAGLLPEILINRAAVRASLGNASGAAADYRNAVNVARKPARYAACAVSYFLHQLEFTNARDLLELLEKDDEETTFLTALTEFYTTEDIEERRRYLEQIRRFANENGSREAELRFHCVDLALKLKDPALATACITGQFKADHPFQACTALAWIALASGDKVAALDNAQKALVQLSPESHPQERRILARTLAAVGHHAEALDICEQLSIPGLLNEDMKSLIDCAQHLERHDLLLRICRELRETEQQDDRLRRLEIRLLDRYAPEQGFSIADDYIRLSPSPAYFTAYRNLFAIRIGRHDAIQLNASMLPAPGDLPTYESRLVILPYLQAGMFDEALRFLYGQLRRHFDDEHAHGQYIFHVLAYEEKGSLRNPPAKVDPQSAVSLEIQGGGWRWVVIENDRPVPSRGEFSEENELSRRLLGRALGDEVDLPGALGRTERATIREIQTKYVRAFQDSLQHFRERFPETSLIHKIHVGSGSDFDPTAIIESLKERRAHVEACIDFYKKNPCTLYLFATRIGISEFDAIKALAAYPTAMVKCCQTTPLAFEAAASEGIPSDNIVLDITAISTLTLTHAWGFLSPDKKYMVSRATKQLAYDWLSEASEEKDREGGHASVTEDGQFLFQEITNEQREARRVECETITEMIEKHCECQSSEAMAAMKPDMRTLYEQVAGFHNVEAMSLARDLNAALWSDDHVLSFIAKTEFGVQTVWTQLALRCFGDAGRLSKDDFDLVSAELASWNYGVIVWNAATIIRAGAHAGWDPEMWPFRQCIALLAKSEERPPIRAQIAIETLKLLRRSTCSELRQSPIIQSVLSAVGDRQAVAWMHRNLKQAFAVDFPSALFLTPELEHWLASRIG